MQPRKACDQVCMIQLNSALLASSAVVSAEVSGAEGSTLNPGRV